MVEDFGCLAYLPGLLSVKDTESNYLGISQHYAELAGWKNAKECSGKTDYEIACEAVKFAEKFIARDKQVISSKITSKYLDIQKYTCGYKAILVEKKPVKDKEEKVVALFCTGIDVTDMPLFKSFLVLSQQDNKTFGSTYTPASYSLSSHHCPLPLTQKQQICLFWLIRGKSLKEIAKILKLSPRTIECHLDTIKIKLHCQYKSEIIEKAIDSGFLHYVPFELNSLKDK